MRRFGLTLSIAASLGVAALIASCSGDGSPISSPEGSVPGLSSTDLNGGGWSPSVAAADNNEGKVTVCHTGNGKNFTQITVSPQGARAHLGDPSSGKGGHSGDFRVSGTTTCPPSSTPGQLQVCKVAGSGVAVGTSFAFAVTTTGLPQTVNVTAGAGPAGNCVNAGTFPVGTAVTIAEGAQTGVSTSSIVVSPAGAQQGTSDLANRSATIIAGSGTTTVTYTNTTGAGGTNGTLVVCKVGGTGVTAGTNFSFTVGAQTVTVAAGAAPNGTCSSPIQLAAGPVNVTEASSAGTIAQSITGTPNPTNVSLAGRSATTQITAGQQSTITFTNVASSSANSGTLVICKVGGAGVTAGTNFTFSAGGQNVTVASGAGPTGTCSSAMTLPVGSVIVNEAASAGTITESITGSPAPTNIFLAGRSAQTAIAAGQQTTITYTNVAATATNTGTLVICKIGGTGVTAGTSFSFSVAGQTINVNAGAAPTGTCSTPITLPLGTLAVAETEKLGTSVSAITGTPVAPTGINLAGRTANVAIAAGQETRITFTNTAP
jgi:hypothetical protein